MAQETNRTGVTAQNDLVPTEQIPQLVREFPYEPTIMMELAHVEPAPKGSVAVRFPRYDQFSVPASAVAESDENTIVALTTSTGTATPAIKRFSLLVNDELKAVRDIPDGMISVEMVVEVMRAVLEDVDTQCLSNVTSATQTYGAATDIPDMDWLDGFIAQYATYRHGRSGPRHAVVLAPNQWMKFIHTSKNSGGAALAEMLAGGDKGTASGYKFTYSNIEIFSVNTVANESGDRRNAVMMPVGRGRAGLGIAVKELFRAVINRGHSGENRGGDWYDIRSWAGYGVADATAMLEGLSVDT